MSRMSKDIPGFYRDPKTGKYYREEPGDLSNPSLKKIKAESVKYNNKILPKVTSIAKHLKRRESGLVSGAHAEKEFCQIRAHGKQQVFEEKLERIQGQEIVSVDFIKGDDTAIFGMWFTKDKEGSFHCVLGEERFMNTPNDHPTAVYRLCNNIIDMCRGPAETLVAVYNLPNIYKSPDKPGYFEFIKSLPVPNRPLNFIESSPLFCCTCVKKEATFALGGNGFVRFFDCFELDYDIPMQGLIYTLSAYEPKEILVSGSQNGQIYLHDPKSNSRFEFTVKISDKAVNDSLFYDENYAIFSDVEGKMVNIDLRKQAVVANYFGHKHSVTKRPFSVASSMLCATGIDNVIRIWSLSGGYPIHEISPLMENENKIRGWLNSNGNKTYLNYFEGAYKKVFEL